MAKQQNKKTVRKKKPTTRRSHHADNAIVKACHKVLNDMFISFSSTHKEIHRHGMDQLAHLLPNREAKKVFGYATKGKTELFIGREALLADLSETSRDWQYWVGVFIDDGDEIACEIQSGKVKDCTMGDLTPIMPELTQSVLNDEVINQDHVKGWAWLAAPSMHLDFASSDTFILDLFIDHFDVLNQDLRAEVEEFHRGSRDVEAA